MNPSGPGLFLDGRLLIAVSTLVLVTGLLTSSWFRLERMQVYQFFPVLLFMCIEMFVIISDDGLYFCGFCGDIPSIVFYCIYLILLSFLFY